jgi:hypothetical protein
MADIPHEFKTTFKGLEKCYLTLFSVPAIKNDTERSFDIWAAFDTEKWHQIYTDENDSIQHLLALALPKGWEMDDQPDVFDQFDKDSDKSELSIISKGTKIVHIKK